MIAKMAWYGLKMEQNVKRWAMQGILQDQLSEYGPDAVRLLQLSNAHSWDT